MAVYWLSYRVTTITHIGRSYSERRDELLKNIYWHSEGSTWEETTSFLMFESNSGWDTLCSAIKKAISPDVDLVLIGKVHEKGGRAIGMIDDPKRLSELMDFVQYV